MTVTLDRLPNLPAAASVAGSDELPIVQSGQLKQATVAQIVGAGGGGTGTGNGNNAGGDCTSSGNVFPTLPGGAAGGGAGSNGYELLEPYLFSCGGSGGGTNGASGVGGIGGDAGYGAGGGGGGGGVTGGSGGDGGDALALVMAF